MLNYLKMIRYLINVAAGNFAHWNENHNKVASDLWIKVNKLNSIEKAIALQSIGSSMQITEQILGPNRTKNLTFNKLSDKQVKSLDYSDFQAILKELVKLFMTLLTIRNDMLSTYCLSVYHFVYGEEFHVSDEINTISEERLKEIVFTGLQNFIKASRIIKSGDPGLSISFFTLVTSLIKPMEQEILNEINN